MLIGLEWRVGREQAGREKGSSGSENLNRMLWVLPEEAGGVWRGALPDMLPHAVFQAQRLLGQRRPHRSFLECFTRALIILCTSQAMVLCFVSICGGNGSWPTTSCSDCGTSALAPTRLGCVSSETQVRPMCPGWPQICWWPAAWPPWQWWSSSFSWGSS